MQPFLRLREVRQEERIIAGPRAAARRDERRAPRVPAHLERE
jgi:hypothetical protein